MRQENEIWNWNSDSQGRITSVSSGFTSTLGTYSAKQIIGNYFWTFAEGIDTPSKGWHDLAESFKIPKKIKKFIFHYTHQKEKYKIAISGEPIFEKEKYIGFSGTGYIADDSEISIPEIANNLVSLSIDNLELGIAIISPEAGLIEFNNYFVFHLESACVKVSRGITYNTILSQLKNHNNYSDRLSNHTPEFDQIYFEKLDKSFLCVKKSTLENGFTVIKTEIDKYLQHNINSYKESISQMKQVNNMLELRIQEYKQKLTNVVSNKSLSNEADVALKKIIEFYENNLDIGILITNINGDIESANYYTAQTFGYTTVSMLMRSDINSEFQKYLLQRNERIIDLIDNSLNRFSHKFFLKNLMYEGDVKEVILFYPNVHSPQKIISVFYPLDKQDDELDKNSLKNLKSSDLYVFQEFIRYMIDDIKTAINVISGYNDLCHIENKHQEVMSYNQQIRESCSQILESIFDVMQVYKISSQASHLEESVFSCEEIITECLEKFTAFINDNKIILNFELHNEGLFVISDKNIFGNALSRIIDAIIRSSANSSKINIKIIEDIKNEKINIIIVDETKLNIEKIFGLDINDIFNNQKIRNTVNINLKIAESYLKLLKFDINAQNYNQNGNIINIQISDDMVTSYHERDSNNVVI